MLWDRGGWLLWLREGKLFDLEGLGLFVLLEGLVSGEGLHEVIVEFQAITHHALVVGAHVGDEVLEFSLDALEGPDHLIEDVVLGNIFNWILVVDDLVRQVHVGLHDFEILLQLGCFGVVTRGPSCGGTRTMHVHSF